LSLIAYNTRCLRRIDFFRPTGWLTRAAKAVVDGFTGFLESRILKGNEMPKMKTKSGAKKRFKLTASGKVRAGQAGKRHGMIKRSNKQIRNQRGTTVLSPQDAKVVRKFLPNG
jgi:large subunit ribosomal protein L35